MREGARTWRSPGLESAGKQQQHQHDHDEAYPATRAIAPSTAVRPGGEDCEQRRTSITTRTVIILDSLPYALDGEGYVDGSRLDRAGLLNSAQARLMEPMARAYSRRSTSGVCPECMSRLDPDPVRRWRSAKPARRPDRHRLR